MQVDKKVRDGKIRLVLLKSIGEAIVTDQYDFSLLRQMLLDAQQS
jgi:3-dehydroquinate synthase